MRRRNVDDHYTGDGANTPNEVQQDFGAGYPALQVLFLGLTDGKEVACSRDDCNDEQWNDDGDEQGAIDASAGEALAKALGIHVQPRIRAKDAAAVWRKAVAIGAGLWVEAELLHTGWKHTTAREHQAVVLEVNRRDLVACTAGNAVPRWGIRRA